MATYYIKSTAYSVVERNTKKNGTVYDAVMYIAEPGGEFKQRRVVTGCKTKKELKQKHADFIASNCELLPKSSSHLAESFTGTLAEAYQQYLYSVKHQIKDSSIVRVQRTFTLYILPTLGNIKLSAISKADLYKWQDDLWQSKNAHTGEPLSHSYLTCVRSMLNTFLTWCEDRYDITNHLRSIKKPKRREQKTEMKIWSQAQFKQFLSVVDDPLYRTIFAVFFYTGRRKGEIVSLYREDVSDSYIMFNKSLTVATLDNKPFKITSTKAEKKYSTPICKPLKDIIADYVPQAPFYFGGEKPIPFETLRRKFIHYTTLAGLPQIRIHDLRHSFVSMLIHLGANYNVIADLIGDTVEQVIKTYGHLYEGDKIAVMNNIV